MMDLALLIAEITNGMYKKPLDIIAKEFQYATARRGPIRHHFGVVAWCLVAQSSDCANGARSDPSAAE
jgi:hypothetical protein